jgi:H2-forming N5,N10-methylenetetrahydromethanopterin dehydrogenase-like enzyme
MDVDESWHARRRYIALEAMKKLLDPELVEPSEQSFELVEEVLELEAQNAIYTT